jgi:hypothetical protein
VFALSWLSLGIAVVSLLVGLSREGLTLVYISIGASVLAMLLLLAGVARGQSPRAPAEAAPDEPAGSEPPG